MALQLIFLVFCKTINIVIAASLKYMYYVWGYWSTRNLFSSFCRETLLGQLTVQIREAEDDFQKRTGQRAGGKDIPKGKNLPEIVNSIVYVRQTEARVGPNFVFNNYFELINVSSWTWLPLFCEMEIFLGKLHFEHRNYCWKMKFCRPFVVVFYSFTIKNEI